MFILYINCYTYLNIHINIYLYVYKIYNYKCISNLQCIYYSDIGNTKNDFLYLSLHTQDFLFIKFQLSKKYQQAKSSQFRYTDYASCCYIVLHVYEEITLLTISQNLIHFNERIFMSKEKTELQLISAVSCFHTIS